MLSGAWDADLGAFINEFIYDLPLIRPSLQGVAQTGIWLARGLVGQK